MIGMVAGGEEIGTGGEMITTVAGMEVEEEMIEVARENQRTGHSLLEEMRSWRRNFLGEDMDLVESILIDMKTFRWKPLEQMYQKELNHLRRSS